MDLSDVVILGLVQGLTEFVPVSSSGHLVLVRLLGGIEDVSGTAFDSFLHLGTLGAVLIYYRNVWWGILRGIVRNDTEGKDKRELAAKLAIATVPGAVAGYAMENVADTWLRSPALLVMGFLITAAVLVVADRFSFRKVSIARASFRDALIIGLAQVVALVPAISRSAMTIAAGRARGLSRKQATTFSFLMSAPIIAGAGLAGLGAVVHNHFPGSYLLIGFLVSFLAGWLAIAGVVRLIERVSFWPFAIYLVILAGMLLVIGL